MRRLVRHLAGALSLSLLPWTFSLSESSVFHALYYVCEGVGGACLYRRQDFSVPLPMADGTAGR